MLHKSNSMFLFFIVAYTERVISQCSSPFISNNDAPNLCYYYEPTPVSWSDAYSRCLNKDIDGILIQILTMEQFNDLENANISSDRAFWIGANNFASFYDSHWHWLDGSVVDNSVITWCPSSTYDVAIGAQCAAYSYTSKCVTNYLCQTPLPIVCVHKTSEMSQQSKSIVAAPRAISSSCNNAYTGAYSNWWTYSTLLLHWFLLLCFILYLNNHFNVTKCTVILTICIILISFGAMVAFAILWGIQYQDLVQIPLIIVILGFVGSELLLLDILILVSRPNYTQKRIACTTVTVLAIVVETILMIALILCIAYCSNFIMLVPTAIDKDIIASLLSALVTAVSIGLINILLILIGVIQRVEHIRVMPANRPQEAPVQPAARQPLVSRAAPSTNGASQIIPAKKVDKVTRATSPVDHRILREFYADRPKDVHSYTMDGRQYVVYEEKNFTDIDTYRKDLTQAMLLQEPAGLREAILRAKGSIYATELTEDIRQAENLANRIK